MRRTVAATGTAVFFCVAPGTVAGVIPWWMTGWHIREPLPYWAPLRVLGVVLLLLAAPVLAHSFVRFVMEGIGTPAPVAPTAHLVVGGIYRHVRNPMYLAVNAAIIGQGLLLGQVSLLVYGVAIALLQAAFVHFYEEPALRRQFGAEYDAYRQGVPAWWLRFRPWHATRV